MPASLSPGVIDADLIANHRAVSDELGLLETGLDSLCFAIIVARLEDMLGVDPFSADDEIDFPVTVGDFIRLYENSVAAAA